MDFTTFDYPEHISALTWLGRREWISYQDLVLQRAISAKPRKLLFQRKGQDNKSCPDTPESYVTIGHKEYERYPSDMWRTLREMSQVLEHDTVGTLWYNTLSKALAGGPKIFRPTAMQCEALQHSEARFAFKDYKQPFPVIILEIPDAYREQLKSKYKIDESPKYVFVHHDDKNRFITVSSFYSKNNIITHVTPDRVEYETIESSLIKNRTRRKDNLEVSNESVILPNNPNIQGSTDAEFDAAENVQRLGINFAMMMSLYTVKVTGPLDPSNYKIWERDARATRNGGLPTNKAKEARDKLAAALHVVEFDQQVSFYDEVEEKIEVAQGVDIEALHKSPRSHWRRGHFAMQACGVGRRERKMIFRKPLLVRAKYFLGDVKDASVTYTIHPGRNP